MVWKFLSKIKKALNMVIGFIIDPRSIIDFFVGREELIETREHIQSIYKERYPADEVESTREDKEQIIRDMNMFTNMSRTQLEAQKVTLAVGGLLIYYLFSFRLLIPYATFFGLEVIARKHVIDIIGCNSIFESDDNSDMLFKHLWNAKMLETPNLQHVMISAVARRWSLVPTGFREFNDNKLIEKLDPGIDLSDEAQSEAPEQE
jgi:hypothetical protein